jgi:hypothetical protein
MQHGEELGLDPKAARIRAMTLRAQLDAITSSFANEVMAAIRGASLQELVGGSATNGRTSRVGPDGRGRPEPDSPPKRTGKPGRLPRRSAEEIAQLLGKIVLLVKAKKEGMRAEEIRSAFGMQPKEMPRILKEGIATKKLTSKGRKRATTYLVR